MGIHLDTDVIYKKNQKKDNVTRKNGCVINIGSLLNMLILSIKAN